MQRYVNRKESFPIIIVFILGDLYSSDDFLRRQKRLHNSDINLNVNKIPYPHYPYPIDTYKLKRQKSNKNRKSIGSPSINSLPSLFLSANQAHDSSATLIGSSNQLFLPSNRILREDAAGDADDEKDIQDELISINRHHRYHHQLSSNSHYFLNQQNLTSEDDDEELLSNHRGMMDFMDRV